MQGVDGKPHGSCITSVGAVRYSRKSRDTAKPLSRIELINGRYLGVMTQSDVSSREIFPFVRLRQLMMGADGGRSLSICVWHVSGSDLQVRKRSTSAVLPAPHWRYIERAPIHPMFRFANIGTPCWRPKVLSRIVGPSGRHSSQTVRSTSSMFCQASSNSPMILN